MTFGEFAAELGKCEKAEYFERFGEIEGILGNLEITLQRMDKKERNALLQELECETEHFPVWMQAHILSFCAKAGGRVSALEKLLDAVIWADYEELGEYNKLSYYWQASTSAFSDMRLWSEKIECQLTRLYVMLFQAFSRALGIQKRNYIPMSRRDRELVLVMTSQVLGEEHAPTKTLLDRCYVLQKFLKKKVLIVNTAMQLAGKGAAPYYRQCEAGYIAELCSRDTISFRGESFEFYQCENHMPDLETMVSMVQMVLQRKPCYMLDIGGSDICADICGMLVPEITISTVFSKVAVSCGEYQLVDKELSEQDGRLLQIMGAQAEHVRRVGFTFSFKEQRHRYTRVQLGLWENAFVILIVGWRLDSEVSDEFLEMLQRVVQVRKRIQVAFMGRFERFTERLAGYPVLRQHSRNLGVQEDALAVTECCDVYVNPKRAGGGSSVSEALYQGVPAVTLPTGDVSVAAGEVFCVRDYKAMEQQILRYIDDPIYYKDMSGHAKERAEYLLDSKGSFGTVIMELEEEMV